VKPAEPPSEPLESGQGLRYADTERREPYPGGEPDMDNFNPAEV